MLSTTAILPLKNTITPESIVSRLDAALNGIEARANAKKSSPVALSQGASRMISETSDKPKNTRREVVQKLESVATELSTDPANFGRRDDRRTLASSDPRCVTWSALGAPNRSRHSTFA